LDSGGVTDEHHEDDLRDDRVNQVLVLNSALEDALDVRLEAQSVADLGDSDGEEKCALRLLEHVVAEGGETDAFGNVFKAVLSPVAVLLHKVAKEVQALVIHATAAVAAHSLLRHRGQRLVFVASVGDSGEG
jgi:hypothetical protein